MTYVKRTGKVLAAWLLTLAVLTSMLVAPASAETGELAFRNASGGEDIISLTDARDYEAVLTLDSAVPAESVTWSLSRERGEQDYSIFPYQYLGGSLGDWKLWESDNAYFTDIRTEAITQGGKPALRLTFSSGLFFGVNRMDAPRANRNVILDYTGDYVLACADADGKTLGQATVRVNPYDDYKTNSELAASLAEAKAAASGIDGLYIDLQSMGVSSQGRDMPYVVISDSRASVESYLALTEQALRDPDGVLARIKGGDADFRVPVLFSNIHPDETPGADAPMNLVWDIVNSFENGGKITYKTLTGFTPEGEARLKAELDASGIQWSGLVSGYVTGLGSITGGNDGSGKVDLEKYYTVADVTLDVNELLDNVILIVCPTENVDGRTSDIRQNGNGFDINRDNMFQTQAETRNMTQLIAKWNPATMVELHGFIAGYQVEPCSPPHEPNFEYDLFAELGLRSGEAFGIGAVANNDEYNSYVMPLRDYLVTDESGDPYWAAPWDDMSTNYTPQYSMLHGSVAFTIEVPAANQAGTTSLEYGLINHAKFVMENKAAFYENQLTGWSRGANNIDEPSIADWYVDMHDNPGAEKDVYRPKYSGNGNFFPECYIIPLDPESQHNPAAAYDMQEFLLRNGVRVHALDEDITVNGTQYKAGSMVVSMYQAKRNVANGALYDGVLITGWTDLYSEPVTAFGKMRGFDCYAIDVKGAVPESSLVEIVSAQSAPEYFSGIEGAEVIIDNDSVEAIALVNDMLRDGAKVGFVTQGEYIADFVVSYGTYTQFSGGYAVKATGVASAPSARLLRQAPIYIPGFAGDFSTDSAGNPYGAFNFPNYGNTNYNFDKFAYGAQMGFEIVDDPASALVIAGNRALDSAAISEVKAGKPYLAAGAGALETVKSEFLGQYGFDYTANNTIQDALY
ncbi:MAG: hypothetical protein LBC21_05030, partial [Oscillospiraceae bacterium]|nr:hypothetical protein [Oscillospiraceae bacterium]